jgi:hypothetical protein
MFRLIADIICGKVESASAPNAIAGPPKLEGRCSPISCGDSDRLIEVQL